jgi:hypothetical protein
MVAVDDRYDSDGRAVGTLNVDVTFIVGISPGRGLERGAVVLPEPSDTG